MVVDVVKILQVKKRESNINSDEYKGDLNDSGIFDQIEDEDESNDTINQKSKNKPVFVYFTAKLSCYFCF